MDKYRRVENSGPTVPKSENEIRITAAGMLGKCVGYAIALLEEKGASHIILKGMGRAISKTVTIAEMIKTRFPELHQNTETGSADINTIWEPQEEGLSTLEMTRQVSTISITLSRTQLNTSSAGYQSPLHADQDQVKPLIPGEEYQHEGEDHSDELNPQVSGDEYEYEPEPGEDSTQNSSGRGRGRGRATGTSEEHVATLTSQNTTDTSGYHNPSLDNGWTQVRGRRRGRGRGRGWAIGGAGNFATLGHQNVDTPGYHCSSANGWNQRRGGGRGNGNHYNVRNQGRGGGRGNGNHYDGWNQGRGNDNQYNGWTQGRGNDNQYHGWTQGRGGGGRGNDNHNRMNAVPRRMGSGGRFGYTGSQSDYSNVNTDSGGRGRGSSGGGD